jgi:serine/threonine-protein kinase
MSYTPFLDDRTLERLRLVADTPDIRGTRYDIVRELARGGTGTVYEAFDRELQRSVALKVVTSPETTPTATRRLEEEARRLAQLEHAGIVPVHEMGTLPDGRVFYAMKLVRGKRLDEVVVTSTRAELLRIFSRLCETVAFAHANGIVHRDLKPQNVMIGPFGEVLVMDWSEVAGTPGYMAPEQSTRDGVVDERTDIFGLGALLRWMLYSSAGSVPRAVAAIAERAMLANSADRYPTVEALAADVAAFVERRRVSAYDEPLWERAIRWVAKYRTPIVLVLAYLALRVALVLGRR